MPETYAALLREVASRIAIERETYGSQGFDEHAPAILRALASLLERITPEAVDAASCWITAGLAITLRALAAGPSAEVGRPVGPQPEEGRDAS